MVSDNVNYHKILKQTCQENSSRIVDRYAYLKIGQNKDNFDILQ